MTKQDVKRIGLSVAGAILAAYTIKYLKRNKLL